VEIDDKIQKQSKCGTISQKDVNSSMKITRWILLLLIPLVTGSFAISPSDDAKHNITVNVTNIRSSKGRIQIQIFRTSEAWESETAYKELYVSKSSMKNKSLTYTIYGLPTGTYGVTLLDDENVNKVMDYGLMLPKEGFGFSDYYHTAWSKPKFSTFSFSLKADKSVTMKVRYM
jgi:uncharacterized protein (DUF2141 family)